jgi:sterol desaturase/sphingolipid hydroxylase (fatty acid hydroxylase superfamily)
MPKQLIGLTFAFIVLTLIFWLVEFFWPGIPGQRRFRAGYPQDVCYWFFTPLVTKVISQMAILVVLVPLFLLLGRKLDREVIQAGYGPVLMLPRWAQALTILVVGDFIGYWSHRWFHGRRLWKFHAVHHSSTELDWLSASRLHPVNELGSRLLQAIPFVLLGFSPLVLAAYVPLLTFYAIFVHANVSWGFGPLRYVIATPLFHRWHHTCEDEALDKNFAGLLPVWDFLFGTLYLPKDKVPTRFGVHDDSVPSGFLGQMAYPFRRAKQAR